MRRIKFSGTLALCRIVPSVPSGVPLDITSDVLLELLPGDLQ